MSLILGLKCRPEKPLNEAVISRHAQRVVIISALQSRAETSSREGGANL